MRRRRSSNLVSEALSPESERRCGGEPTVQEGGCDPSINKKTPTVLGIQQMATPGLDVSCVCVMCATKAESCKVLLDHTTSYRDGFP